MSCLDRGVLAARTGAAREPGIAQGADKASLLATLHGAVRGARIPDGRTVERGAWQSDRKRVESIVRGAFGAAHLAVRSARPGEDAVGAGGAGLYRSVLDVPMARLGVAIDTVFASYGGSRRGDRVLIQPFVAGIEAAIVAASHAPGDGAPYHCISRADGADPAAITAGTAAADTLFVAHHARVPVPAWARRVLGVLREVEAVAGGAPFELELVLARRTLWLLQFRPLASPCVPASVMRVAHARAQRALARAEKGRGPTLFGLMPDWNPAELLGEHPRPLARSLFDVLIARGTWWRARAALGYRRPTRDALLRTIAGRPCVDVAASFESLLPRAVDAADAAAAVTAWCRRLRAQPALHDRVELEVAVTCAEFDRTARLRESGLGDARARRIGDALRHHSQAILEPQAVATERESAERRARACWPVPGGPQALRVALAHVRQAAALPFARAARLDFIGAALLRSAVRTGALAPDAADRIRAAPGTVAGALVRNIDVSSDDDLRPGTFEIDVPATGLADLPRGGPAAAQADWRPDALDRLDALLAADGWRLDGASLARVAADASRAREIGKFALARAIAALLEGIAGFGQRLGLDRRTLGWLTLPQLVAAAGDAGALRALAARAEARHAAEHPLRVPTLIGGPADLRAPLFAAGRPSFLGERMVEGRVVRVARDTSPLSVPSAAVLAIDSADPGFDWVFLRQPAALLTAFGGPQSHMALRCVELGVPAVLGLGPPRFQRLARCGRLRVDPRRHALSVIVEAP